MSEGTTSIALRPIKYCPSCGTKAYRDAQMCEACRFDFASIPNAPIRISDEEVSSKSFGVAVSLCGVFGLMGIHHFYLGNFLHGIFDLSLFVAAIVLLSIGSPIGDTIGSLFLVVDLIHTCAVMYWLFTGQTRDGRGRLVVYPGQVAGP